MPFFENSTSQAAKSLFPCRKNRRRISTSMMRSDLVCRCKSRSLGCVSAPRGIKLPQNFRTFLDWAKESPPIGVFTSIFRPAGFRLLVGRKDHSWPLQLSDKGGHASCFVFVFSTLRCSTKTKNGQFNQQKIRQSSACNKTLH